METMKTMTKKLVDRGNLTESEAESAMRCIMSGEATPAQISSFLTALRLKGETVAEITAFARVMRQFAAQIKPNVGGTLVDTCGTGGDKIKTFNISTAVALVAAGAGIPIAKHGNRSVTSKAGSADVLETLGVKIDLEPQGVKRCIEEIGFGFMFAPVFHRAMKYATPVRREMGIRTVFNVLGPLTNPANAQAQILGVYDCELTEKLAGVLKGLGVKRAMVVHGLDGLDEISNLGRTQISELKDCEVRTYIARPRDFGFNPAKPQDIRGYDREKNAGLMLKLLHGGNGPRRDIILMNSAAAMIVGGKASNFKEGVEIAKETIDSGGAYEKLMSLIEATSGDISKLEALEGKL
jgi:anthranilate phosphoribosyltransferase